MTAGNSLAVPWIDLTASYREQQAAIDEAFRRVMASGWYILGQEVTAFEEELARFVGVRHAIGVANGTEALQLALWACGVKDGDSVLTVSHTASATAAGILLAGAKLVLADIEPGTFTLDVEKLKQACRTAEGREFGSRIKAVVVVHLYGHPVDMQGLSRLAEEFGWEIIEDCAQAHGALCAGRPVGTWGRAAAFSFYPTKNLGAFGDGGAVTTNDADVARRLRLLRQYGWEQRYVSEQRGINSRLDELQAAFLRVRLKSLADDNQRRIDIAARYSAALCDLPIRLPACHRGCTHVYHQYVVRLDNRDALAAALHQRGIGTAVLYPAGIHQQPWFAGHSSLMTDLCETERAVRDLLCLPMYPALQSGQVEQVIEAVRASV